MRDKRSRRDTFKFNGTKPLFNKIGINVGIFRYQNGSKGKIDADVSMLTFVHAEKIIVGN